MTNPYYTPGSFTPHTKVTAESVNDEFSNVEDGFDAVETAITDAESAVQNSATAAADSATAAAASALSAANAKTDAESAKTAAETAQTNAETAETNAETAQAAAEEASLGLKYTFDDSTTMADPTAGYLRLNNATIASVTEIALDDTCAFTGNPDMSAYLLTWDDSDSATKGHVIIRNMSDANDFAVYKLTGLTDESGWVRLAVTYVTNSGSFSDESDVAVSFFRTGDRGQSGMGTGDMLASTYDPNTISGDAFDMDNMVEGTTTKIMTDTERTKLTNIEALADVTDTANVTAAGALMDSELTSEASVKALNQGVATTDSPTFVTPSVKNVLEAVFALSGTTPALDPGNGSIQTWTLSGNSSPTDSLAAGESITLMIDDGSAYTITWPTMQWIGGSAPTLATSGYSVVELWKVGSTLYGAYVGDLS